MGAVMKDIVIAAEFAAMNRAKIIKTNDRCCCFAIPRINFDSRRTMEVQNVQAVQSLRSVQIVKPVRATSPSPLHFFAYFAFFTANFRL
jgi:hypothetical protein